MHFRQFQFFNKLKDLVPQMCTFNWRYGEEELLKILCRRVEEIAPPCGRNYAAVILIFDLGFQKLS
jgi:hypothetical protein